MKKVLILSYFFPPGNFAGSYRIQSWAKYLSEFGYYPIVITRKWEDNMNDYSDMSKPTSDGIEFKKFDNYEVYYLPYKSNLRDNLLVKYGKDKYKIFRKILTLKEVVFQNFKNSVIPFNNIYYFSKTLLINNPDIRLVITSGKPFILFKFCYLLHKTYNIKWIADYRDDWNSTQWKRFYNNFQLFFLKVETHFERNWIKSAEYITSVSDYYVDIISTFVNKNGASIMNGYDEADYPQQNHDYYNEFTIVYNGTLYNSQPIEIFLDGLKKTIETYKNIIKVQILFPGLSVDKQRAKEIKEALKGYEDNYLITGRIKKEEVIEIQLKSHVLLMVGHTGIKGTTSSKIFEYLACRKTIMLCPSDKDIIETIIKETKSGFICNTSYEVEILLKKLIDEFIKTGKVDYKSDTSEIEKYSRKNQTKKLAKVFDTINISDPNFINHRKSFRDLVFKGLYYSGLNKILNKLNNEKIIILCFHNISDNTSYSYPHLSVACFEKIIIYLKKNFNIIRLNEISEIKDTSKPNVIITFDDGYKDFITNALPILIKHKVPSLNNIIVGCVESSHIFWSAKLNLVLDTIYKRSINFSFSYKNITIDYNVDRDQTFEKISIRLLKELYNVDKLEREDFLQKLAEKVKVTTNSDGLLMDWADLRHCIENGVAIGSHTLTHDSLISTNDIEQIIKEILDSKIILEEKLKTEINIIAFPNGLYNNAIYNIAKKHYKYILSTEETGLKSKDIERFSDNLLLPRVSLNKRTFEENILKLNRFHDLFYKIKIK